MTDNVENLILEQLRGLRNQVTEFRDELRSDVYELKQRLSSLEASVISGRRDDVALASDLARHQVSLDQLIQRIQRIEHRLDLVDHD